MRRQLLVIGLSALVASSAAAAPSSVDDTILAIDGAAPTPKRLSRAEFVALPRVTAMWTVHGKTVACEGPWLIDVLTSAGLPTGDDVRGPALATVVAATASDGYRAVFTLGELDRKLGNAPILIADTCDGAVLPPEDGPLRIVAASDERGARSVRGLVRLTVIATPTTP